MTKDFVRMDQKNVGYSRAFWNVLFRYDRKNGYPKDLTLTIDSPDAVIHYTTDGSEVTLSSPLYKGEAIVINRGDLVRAQGFVRGKSIGKPVDKQF